MSRLRPHAPRWLRSLVLALPALAVSAAAASAQASDLNADGKGDLLWHHQATGELYVWLMNGTVAASGSYLSPARVADLGWQIRGLADFNADGKLDVLWHHQTTGDLYVWLMAGTSVSSGAYLTPSRGTDIGWQVKGVADLNGDARPDLLWQNQSGGEFSVWLMNGVTRSSTVATTPAALTDPQWQIRGLADFNGDGQPDVLWHHQATGDLYVWFMSGTSATGGSYLTPSRFADTRWQIRSLNDVNADGKADLLWHHQATGDLYVWLMNGTRVTAGSYLTPSRFADTRWQIVPRPPSGAGPPPPQPACGVESDLVPSTCAEQLFGEQVRAAIESLPSACGADPRVSLERLAVKLRADGLCAFAGVEAVFVKRGIDNKFEEYHAVYFGNGCYIPSGKYIGCHTSTAEPVASSRGGSLSAPPRGPA